MLEPNVTDITRRGGDSGNFRAMATRPLTLADVLETMADTVPDRPAIVTLDHTWTFAELDERANRFAHMLLDAGVQPGTHVAVHSPNRVEWIDAFYGSFKIGAVPINVNYKYLAEELRHIYSNSDSTVAVVAPEFEALAREAAGDLVEHWFVMGEQYDAATAAASPERPQVERSGDDRYMIYTGGTTGMPKGVEWRQEDLIRAALNAARYGAPLEGLDQLAAEAKAVENPMVLLACGPMMHGGSQWIMGNGHVAGQTIGFFTDANFSAERVLDLVQHAGVVSLTFLGDAMGRPVAEAILAEPDRWDLSSLAAVSNGAAPLSIGVREEIRKALPGRFILDSYGASETGAAGSSMDDGSSDGKARFNIGPDVDVLGADDRPTQVGEEGMLARSGPMPLGYYKDPVKTAATFKEIDGKRWVIPGDFARKEPDGSIIVLGRGSVCINSGGEKIYPEEVESALLRHPDIFDAAVTGTPHERWGQQVTALVQLREDADLTEAQVVEHVKSLLANYKAPKRVFFVDQVPRTPVSKVDYKATAETAAALVAESAGAPA